MDPCLFVKDLPNGKHVYIAMWADDCLMIEERKEIDVVLIEIKKEFKIKAEESLSDWLDVE